MTQNNTQETNEQIAREVFKSGISGAEGHHCVWEASEQEKLEFAIKEALDTKDLKITSLEAQIEGFKIMKDESEYMRGYHAGEVYAFGTCDGYLAKITSLEESLRKARETLSVVATGAGCELHKCGLWAKSTLSEIEKDISK